MAEETANGNGNGKKSPPYMSYKSFQTYLEGLRATGVPSQIDRSTLRNMSGTQQSQLLGTLAFFGLIVGDKPQASLEKLVHAKDEIERKALVKALLEASYDFLFDGAINLAKATSKQVEDAFREKTGVSGDTVRKAFVFFIGMAKDAGTSLSTFLASTKTRTSTGARRRASGKINTPDDVEDDTIESEEHGEVIDVPDGFVIHNLQLRRDLFIKIALPADFNNKDVTRLQSLLRVIPFEEEAAKVGPASS